MGKLIVIVILLGGGYWYWSGPYQAGRPSPEEAQLQRNAENMRKCMRQEASMQGSAGMAGVGGIADGGEQLCADKFSLYQRDGQWHSRGSDRD
jgi:hypothetical protein